MRAGATSIIATAALALGLVAGAFALRPVVGDATVSACLPPSRTMTRLELLFGSDRKGAPAVSAEEWTAFVDREVTPRFPDGLTVLSADGQWRGSDGALVKERSRVVVVWHEPTAKSHADAEAIRAAYKGQFAQESVMRVDSRSCVSF